MPNPVYHGSNHVPAHTDERQPVEGQNPATFCSTCGDWFKPVTVDLMPKGLETPEGQQKVSKALDEWTNATAEVANALEQFFNESFATTAQALRKAGYRVEAEELHQLQALIGARSRKQEAFLRAIAGR